MSESVVNHLYKTNRGIVLFSHSSYWDFIIMALYDLSYPEFHRKLYVLIKPQPFVYWGWLLRPLGGIPSSRLEDTHSGLVDRLVGMFADKNKDFLLLLSPKGSLQKLPWRSGYYNIAKKLNCPIIVGGIDYKDKEIRIEGFYSADIPREELEPILQKAVSTLIPLYPSGEWLIPITENQTVIEWSMLRYSFILFMTIILIKYF
jgi:1-acyl-sn-glycerol-3-phosphate acyltransferase